MHGGRWHAAWALGACTACPCYVPDVRKACRQVLVCARSTSGGGHRSWRLMAFGNRTARPRASSAARCRAHGAKLSTFQLPSVVAGNIGRRHRSWRLMAFGNGTARPHASSAARCRAHGAIYGVLFVYILQRFVPGGACLGFAMLALATTRGYASRVGAVVGMYRRGKCTCGT